MLKLNTAIRGQVFAFVIILPLLLGTHTVLAQEARERESTIDLQGSIAIIGNDRNVYLFGPANVEAIQITDDAEATEDGYRLYTWPTWSTDGRLAYFSMSLADGATVTTQAYVASENDGDLIYTGEGNVFNYASWAPENCDSESECRVLSILMNSAGGGLFVENIRDQVEGNPNTTIGRGGPFYYSWSPDGQQMIWQRNNNRLDIYEVGTDDATTQLDQQPGVFQAPHWSPVDDRLLFGKLNLDTRTTDLVVVSGDDETALATDLDGILYFAWSPDGEKVAYVDGGGPLTVVDAQTGELISETLVGGVASFFWSPDSSKLAYITLATPADSSTAQANMLISYQQQSSQIAWSVLDVQTGDINRYGGFTPTRDMVYMFTYFDQFSRSHQIWSPDSRYIVYSEVLDDTPTINILDTRLDSTVPVFISEGTLGIWSFN
jgi:TolB protein